MVSRPATARFPEIVPRDEFLSEVFDYRPGEHLTILGPTGSGKTWLANQLLKNAASPDLPAIVLVMKPQDPVAEDWAKQLKHRIVRTWPPPPSFTEWFARNAWNQRRSGYVLWPKHSFDPRIDNVRLYQEFRRAMLDSYKRGKRILFADETWGLVDLGLTDEIETIHTRGRSMETGLWVSSQRPTYIPRTSYSQTQHLFLAREPDLQARKRYREISGIDVMRVDTLLGRLPPYQWLYITDNGRHMCIVDK
jgi:energy-coupling factor transporter ATP-binding protein EcfA2